MVFQSSVEHTPPRPRGEKFISSYEIDAGSRIAAPTSFALSNVSTTNVTGTWAAVTGAAYLFDLWNDTDGGNPFNQWNWTSNTTATVTGTAMDTTKAYSGHITVFTIGTPGGKNSLAFTGTLPKQFNQAWLSTKIIFPGVTSITVNAPTSNALKINVPTGLTAVAKDSSGTVMTKTFTWNSSDPNIASVDTNGMVTAKRFGTVTITASADGINGASSLQTTYGLEAIGGTKISTANPQIGTAFLARFRNRVRH